MMQCQAPEDPPTCRLASRDTHALLYVSFSFPTTRVDSYQTATGRAILKANPQQWPLFTDHPALTLVQTFPNDRGSSKTKI